MPIVDTGNWSDTDLLMFGVLTRRAHEESHENRPDYLLALDWVLAAWRDEDDLARDHMAKWAEAFAVIITEDEAPRVTEATAPSRANRHEWVAGRCTRCGVRWHERGTGAWGDPCIDRATAPSRAPSEEKPCG